MFRQHLQVRLPDAFAPEHRVVGEDLLHLDARHLQVLAQPDDVLVGHEAAVGLDAVQARKHERGIEPRGKRAFIRSNSGMRCFTGRTPAMIMPKVGTRSASCPPSSMRCVPPTWTKLGARQWTFQGVPSPVETR